MVQISSVQSQNVNLPIGRVHGTRETKRQPSNQETSTRFATHPPTLQSSIPANAVSQPVLSQISSSSTSTSTEETKTTEEVSTTRPTAVSPSASPLSSLKASITSSAVTSSSSVISNVAPPVVYTTSTSTSSQILHTTRTPSHTEPTTITAGAFIPSSSASNASKPSHLGAIIGGIVGGVAFAFIIALIALLKWHRRRQISSVQKTAFNGDMMVKPPFNWRNVARSWKSRSIASSLPRRWHGSEEKNGNEHKPSSEIEGDNGFL